MGTNRTVIGTLDENKRFSAELLLEQLRRILEIAVETGTVTSADSTHLTDATKKWGTDIWKGAIVEITAGTGAGQIRKVTANTADTLTVDPAWDTVPDTTSRYAIRIPMRNVNVAEWGGASLTGADITKNIQNLDIALSAHRDALRGGDNRTLTDLYNQLSEALKGLPSGVETVSGSASVSAGAFGSVVSITLAAGAKVIIFGFGASHDVGNNFKIAVRLYDETADKLVGPYKTAPADWGVEVNTPVVVENTDTVDHTISVQAYNAHTAALTIYGWMTYKAI